MTAPKKGKCIMKEINIKEQAFEEENTTNSIDTSFMIQDFLNSGISRKTIDKYMLLI